MYIKKHFLVFFNLYYYRAFGISKREYCIQIKFLTKLNLEKKQLTSKSVQHERENPAN